MCEFNLNCYAHVILCFEKCYTNKVVIIIFLKIFKHCFSGTRFRPLSFEVPKPLFPVAGVPMLQHHIEACAKVSFILKYRIVTSFEMLALVCFFLFCKSLVILKILKQLSPHQ